MDSTTHPHHPHHERSGAGSAATSTATTSAMTSTSHENSTHSGMGDNANTDSNPHLLGSGDNTNPVAMLSSTTCRAEVQKESSAPPPVETAVTVSPSSVILAVGTDTNTTTKGGNPTKRPLEDGMGEGDFVGRKRARIIEFDTMATSFPNESSSVPTQDSTSLMQRDSSGVVVVVPAMALDLPDMTAVATTTMTMTTPAVPAINIKKSKTKRKKFSAILAGMMNAGHNKPRDLDMEREALRKTLGGGNFMKVEKI